MGNGHVPKKKIPGLTRLLIVILLALAASLAFGWKAYLSSLGGFLVDSQPPQMADLIVVLGGDFWGPRVLKGAGLARQGYAPLVLFSGALYRGRPEGEFAVSYLVQLGYSPTLFAVFPQAADSTIAEAVALRGELARRHVKRAIIVTSNYHSRRAAIVLHLFCPGIDFISIPAFDSHYHPQLWWKDPSSRQIFFSEWTKIFGSVLIAYPTYLVRLRGG